MGEGPADDAAWETGTEAGSTWAQFWLLNGIGNGKRAEVRHSIGSSFGIIESHSHHHASGPACVMNSVTNVGSCQ